MKMSLEFAPTRPQTLWAATKLWAYIFSLLTTVRRLLQTQLLAFAGNRIGFWKCDESETYWKVHSTLVLEEAVRCLDVIGGI